MSNRGKLIAVIIGLAAAGCAQGAGDAGDVPPAVAQAQREVVYFDSEVFDLQLSQSIRSAYPEITVRPANAITINHIPPRLNSWLVAVQRNGGSVSLVALKEGPDGKRKEFIQVLLPIALELIAKFVSEQMDTSRTATVSKSDLVSYIRKNPLFVGVGNTVVTINYDDTTKQIENVVFRKL